MRAAILALSAMMTIGFNACNKAKEESKEASSKAEKEAREAAKAIEKSADTASQKIEEESRQAKRDVSKEADKAKQQTKNMADSTKSKTEKGTEAMKSAMTDKDKGKTEADKKTTKEIRAALEDNRRIPDSEKKEIGIHTENGKVKLTGTVASDMSKIEAAAAASKVAGKANVKNEIKVAEKVGAAPGD
jgi:osmotically-inducible protein OsmY